MTSTTMPKFWLMSAVDNKCAIYLRADHVLRGPSEFDVLRGPLEFDDIWRSISQGWAFFILEESHHTWPRHAAKYLLTCRYDATWLPDAKVEMGPYIRHRDIDVAITQAVLLAGRGVETLKGIA